MKILTLAVLLTLVPIAAFAKPGKRAFLSASKLDGGAKWQTYLKK
ncbi:MAG TPA: hypothetical protein VE133_13635 [Candidatus Sulfotelmatobacter sp.]|nr:hypothetical protein [Candidatus Sulfotelmatobacter sp.]